MAKVLIGVNQLGTLLSVVIIDVVLAGDNAIVVGMAASGLPIERRRNVICLGIAAATVLRIFFAYFAVQLLAVIGLTLAGGVLLLWVSWKMYRESRETQIGDPVATADCILWRSATDSADERDASADPHRPSRCIDVARQCARCRWDRAGSFLAVGVRARPVGRTDGRCLNLIARLLDRHF